MRRLSIAHLVIVLCLSVFAWSTSSIASEKNGLLKIYFFDIGQGDAIFIESPSGQQVLIDGGPDNKILSKLGETMPFWDNDIDVVIATHPHADHIGGLIQVLGRYNIKNIIEAKESYNSPEFKAWEEAIKKEDAQEIEAMAGKIIDMGDGVNLKIMFPFESVAGTETKTPHDDDVVVKLEYKNLDVMLTGDLEAKIERQLIIEGYDLDSDVLKVGHHGSKTSSSEEFLSAVTPEVGIIQVGLKNKYGLPSPEVLSRLENFGIKYYRNDLDGTIKIISDGINYQVITER